MKSDVLKTLLDTGNHSDLTLVCDGKEFPVHKSIICTQSPVFEKACKGPWKGASENVIRIDEFDAVTVERMVSFLYKKEYKCDEEIEEAIKSLNLNNTSEIEKIKHEPFDSGCRSPTYYHHLSEWMNDDALADRFFDRLKPHICMNAIGDFYMIPELKKLAKSKIDFLLHNDVFYPKGFMAAANYVFETTGDKSLHDIMIAPVLTHLIELQIMQPYYANADSMNHSFALKVVAALSAKLLETDYRLRREVEKLKHRENNMELELKNVLDRNHNLVKDIDDCINRLQELNTCGECRRPININIVESPIAGDDYPEDPKYIITCRGCDAKH